MTLDFLFNISLNCFSDVLMQTRLQVSGSYLGRNVVVTRRSTKEADIATTS